jgi:hypothetical protein
MNVHKTKDGELATPLNLARMYPDCGLTSVQIGYAYHIGAVKGIKPRGARTSLIYIKSFEKFIEFRDSVHNKKY